MAWSTIIVGILLLGVLALFVMNLLKVDVGLLFIVAIIMTIVLFGIEMALFFLSENECDWNLVIYGGITFVIAVVLSLSAFKKEVKSNFYIPRRANERVQSDNTTTNRRVPQKRHRATRSNRRGRR